MSIPSFTEIVEPNDQTEARKASLAAISALVGNAYPNKFARSHISGSEDTITALKSWKEIADVEAKMAAIKATLAEGERPPAEEKDKLNAHLREFGNVRIAGRLTTPPRGNFVHLTDGMNKLQVYCNKKGPLALVKNDGANTLDEENGWALWQLLDHGDLIGAEGYLFVTNTGEVSVHVEKLQFLAKAMLPMPDKMHGIADAEIRQRQRYYDLIGSSLQVEHEGLTTRDVFERRAKIISSMRRYLEDSGYVEVETPMLTAKATGAAAKPFKTHHNALDIDLYARIAPELYLKRLVVGGFEKVYELNRNFRNEGISYKHNPEFTMLEFYCAYMDVEGMMDFCEELMRQSVQKATGGLVVNYEGNEVDFSKFRRLSMKDSIVNTWDSIMLELTGTKFDGEWFNEPDVLAQVTEFVKVYRLKEDAFPRQVGLIQNKFAEIDRLGGHPFGHSDSEVKQKITELKETNAQNLKDSWSQIYKSSFKSMLSVGDQLAALFEWLAEPSLIQPTFIIDYPKSISPLSKASPSNPQIAERFELFINGMEVANGFSELNDPLEQYERFKDQMEQREGGDEEAMVLDEDYIRALSYGMPPAAGIGIGIDRLVMLLTNKHSIRDVILFPHMRPEKKELTTENTESTKEEI